MKLLRNSLSVFALVAALSGIASATTIFTEIPGNFVGKGCGTGGTGTGCGTLNGVTGFLSGNTWTTLGQLPQGSSVVAGSGTSTTTTWLAPNGVYWTCNVNSCGSVNWQPTAVGPSGQLGGQSLNGYAAVDGLQLSAALPASSILTYFNGGWAGGVFGSDGISSQAAIFNPFGVASYLPCATTQCLVTAGDGDYLGGFDGTNAVQWGPGGIEGILGTGYVNNILGTYIALSSGFAGQIGGPLNQICLTQNCSKTVSDPFVASPDGRFIGSGSLVVGDLGSTTSTPEPGTLAMFTLGGVLLFAGSRHRLLQNR